MDIEIYAAGLLSGLITFPILWMLITTFIIPEDYTEL